MIQENKLAKQSLIIAFFVPLILHLPPIMSIGILGTVLFLDLYILLVAIYEGGKR